MSYGNKIADAGQKGQSRITDILLGLHMEQGAEVGMVKGCESPRVDREVW